MTPWYLQQSDPGSTRDLILDLAENLIQDRGYTAFSYRDISAPLGIKNAAVHYHFPSKVDLAVSTVKRYRERFADYVAAHVGRDPLSQLKAYFAISLYHLKRNRVCPVGSLEADYHALPEALQFEVQRLDEEVRAWLVDIMRMGLASGSFTFKGTPETKAFMIASALQGALQLARTAGSSLFISVVRQIKHDLGLDT